MRLARIQNELFDVGADLSVPWGISDRLRVEQPMIDRLEQLCDEFNADLRSSAASSCRRDETSAQLHVARTICRRAEREVLLGAQEVELNPLVLAYLNRLSDLSSSPARRTPTEDALAAWELRRPAPRALAGLAWAAEPGLGKPSRRSGNAAGDAGGLVGGASPDTSALLGLVLGTLRLPLIVALTGSPLAAAGTNIAISAASAGAGAIRHARERRVDWRVVAWMARRRRRRRSSARSWPTTSPSGCSTPRSP